MLFEAVVGVVAKIASASTVAQATAGLGIAVAGVTGAGAAGVLPGPVQDSVAAAVQAVTPFDLPDSTDRHDAVAVHSPEPARPADATSAEQTQAPSAASPTAIPSATPEAEDDGAGAEDGTHQHRGGRTTSAASGADESEHATASEDHAKSGPTPATTSGTMDDHGGGSGSSGSGSGSSVSGSGSSGSGADDSRSGRHGG